MTSGIFFVRVEHPFCSRLLFLRIPSLPLSFAGEAAFVLIVRRFFPSPASASLSGRGVNDARVACKHRDKRAFRQWLAEDVSCLVCLGAKGEISKEGKVCPKKKGVAQSPARPHCLTGCKEKCMTTGVRDCMHEQVLRSRPEAPLCLRTTETVQRQNWFLPNYLFLSPARSVWW